MFFSLKAINKSIMVINNYKELTLANDYIFSKVMRNKALEVEYMTLLMREQERYEDGLREGWQQGIFIQ